MSIKINDLEKEAAKDFWLWMIRVVKPEVIDGKEFIECHGFGSDGMVPVASLKDLIDRWHEEARQEKNEKINDNITDLLAMNKTQRKIIQILSAGIRSSLENNNTKWLHEALHEAGKIGIDTNNKFVSPSK
ncbi:MAG TPA: hypothetical protein VD884_13290 [Ohtaekwangia sp.]|nr:hypothetical protein [Ohtaekwangia sp.]